MEQKPNKVEVLIGGVVYKLSSGESVGYIKTVADYINLKIAEIDGAKAHTSNQNVRWLLLALNIADELFKQQNKVLESENEIDQRNIELERYYDELGKMQEENLLLNEKIGELQLEINRVKMELNDLLN